MNEALARRMGALAGLALAAAVALWWLGSARIALERGSDASQGAGAALQALWLVRVMALAVMAVRVGALRGWQAGAAVALGLVTPAWPVVALAGSAIVPAWPAILLTELLLLAACAGLPLLGQGLRRVLPNSELLDVASSGLGVALALALWILPGPWTLLAP